MTITFTYAENDPDCESAGRKSSAGPWLLEIDGAKNDLFKAASIVRTYAIETGDVPSIRLVRLLKDAKSPEEIASAISAFRKWTAAVLKS